MAPHKGHRENIQDGPDKGWSWVVACSSCFIWLLLFGLVKSSGVFFIATMQAFGVSRERAAWPYNLMNTVYQILGIVAGILCHHFGVRKVAVLGGILSSFGVAMCYFADSILWITLFYGVVFGAGYSLVFSVIPVIVNQYFHYYKSIAFGIAASGASAGGLIMPMVIESLHHTYGFSGHFLVLGGILLNVVVAASLYRAPPWLKREKISSLRVVSVQTISQKLDASTPNGHSAETDYQKEIPCKFRGSTELCNGDVNKNIGHCYKVKKCEFQLPVSSQLSTEAQDSATCSTLLKSFSRTLKIIAEIGKSPHFIIIVTSSLIFLINLVAFYTIILDFAIDKGVKKSVAKYLVLAASVGSLLGTLGLGWVTDKQLLSRRTFTMVAMVTWSVIIACFPFANSFAVLFTFSFIYGMVESVPFVMYPLLLAEYFGPEKHPISVGLMQFVNGVASFLRPPLIGYFRDTMGSYDGLFFTLSGMAAVGGLVWLLEPCFEKKHS